jgi:hypothetical protein
VPGVDVASAQALFGPSADGLADLAPRGRATLDGEAAKDSEVLARWLDGAPLVLDRTMGRGIVRVITLPLTTDESDFVLRPAFLAFLERFLITTRARGAARRIEVGEAWTFDGAVDVTVSHRPRDPRLAPTPIQVSDSSKQGERRKRAVAPLAGLYTVRLGEEVTTRVATIPDREIDLRSRGVVDSAHRPDLGGVSRSLDVSPQVAMLFVALLGLELALRVADLWRKARVADRSSQRRSEE